MAKSGKVFSGGVLLKMLEVNSNISQWWYVLVAQIPYSLICEPATAQLFWYYILDNCGVLYYGTANKIKCTHNMNIAKKALKQNYPTSVIPKILGNQIFSSRLAIYWIGWERLRLGDKLVRNSVKTNEWPAIIDSQMTWINIIGFYRHEGLGGGNFLSIISLTLPSPF